MWDGIHHNVIGDVCIDSTDDLKRFEHDEGSQNSKLAPIRGPGASTSTSMSIPVVTSVPIPYTTMTAPVTKNDTDAVQRRTV